MRLNRFILVLVIFIFSCSEDTFQQEGDIFYKRGSSICSDDKNHWLIDIKAQNSKDSIYLDTRALGRKIEIHRLNTDTTTTFIQLLSSTCKTDSIQFRLKAQPFYKALNGSVPSYLNDTDFVTTTLWMRDKLNDIEHIAYKKAFERSQIDQFIKNQRWNGTLDSSSLIYYEKLKMGYIQPVKFKKAKIKYVLKKINGQVIYSTKDEEPFIYDVSDQQVIVGIQFLASKLSKSESIRAIVPSDFAFGATGNNVISGYTPIIIEMELIDYIL